jgi:hypothetical protein
MRGAPPVTIPLPGGGALLMRGAADKVDRDINGRLYVTDLKSGSARDFKISARRIRCSAAASCSSRFTPTRRGRCTARTPRS